MHLDDRALFDRYVSEGPEDAILESCWDAPDIFDVEPCPFGKPVYLKVF
jgi:hypothetical protein